MVATTVCDLHLDDFPFDNQTCSLDFNSFLLNNKEQTFDPQIIADYNYDMGNSEFKVISLYAYIQLYDQANEQFEMVSFKK
uniref:Neurotransmitter-gated ion-channel ligand-binding domain-containing protein n=1 Tax=Panagrolaimus davidi TaxID=227884 RepID=A0A914Q5R9_9BILA